MKNNKYIDDLVACAKEIYIATFEKAYNNDFCDRTKLYKLDQQVFEKYSKLYKKPLKCFKMLVTVACVVYNNEMIVDNNIFGTLTILNAFIHRKLYTKNKLENFITNKGIIELMHKGTNYSSILFVMNKIDCKTLLNKKYGGKHVTNT